MTDRLAAIAARLSAMSEDEQETPEGRLLFAEFLFHAPPELQALMREKFDELCPELPIPARCGTDGERLWTDQQLADYLGVSVEEVRNDIERLTAHGLLPGVSDATTGEWVN